MVKIKDKYASFLTSFLRRKIWFGEIFLSLQGYRGPEPYKQVVMPAMAKARNTIDSLDHFRVDNSPGFDYEVRREDLWQWYALDRLNDLMKLIYQGDRQFYRPAAGHGSQWERSLKSPGNDRGFDWSDHPITREQYLEFFASLGFEIFTDRPYHPFYYEIVEAVESPGLPEEVKVDHVYWPGLMFGSMMFSRAGARVLFRPGAMDKTVAETSQLYFTYWRLHRKTIDLSHGWGHNSQWRTRFRRDYETFDRFIFNVDGRRVLNEFADYRTWLVDEEPDDLTMNERIELLTNRCFIRCLKDDGDRWPFDDKYEIAKSQ